MIQGTLHPVGRRNGCNTPGILFQPNQFIVTRLFIKSRVRQFMHQQNAINQPQHLNAI